MLQLYKKGHFSQDCYGPSSAKERSGSPGQKEWTETQRWLCQCQPMTQPDGAWSAIACGTPPHSFASSPDNLPGRDNQQMMRVRHWMLSQSPCLKPMATRDCTHCCIRPSTSPATPRSYTTLGPLPHDTSAELPNQLRAIAPKA